VRLILASRKSDLARIQAYSVGDALKKNNPSLKITFQFRESLGDKNSSSPLWKMPERGVFTEDFHADLISGAADLVVHSWKDLPVEEREGTKIVATMPRADARDVLLVRKDRWLQVVEKQQMRIFSSSPRRAYNLEKLLLEILPAKIKALNFEPVRGNVPTRIKKLLTEDADGLVVAKAALDRLLGAPWEEFVETRESLRENLSHCLWMVLPLRSNPTAAAQGALAIEIKRDRPELEKLLSHINCESTFQTVQRERVILKSYGGGCHQKIGVTILERPYGEITYLQGLTDSGEKLDGVEFKGSPVSKVSRDFIWPVDPKEAQFFERLPIDSPLPSGPLWVARADALPETWKIPGDRPVWVAGHETWKKLAARGVWVMGSAEGLGESEDPQISRLWGAPLAFTKLTHETSESLLHEGMMKPLEPIKKTLMTYKLKPKEGAMPELRGKTHFYWMSGSAFVRAMEIFPEIATASHSCGPGNTYQVIKERLKNPQRLSIFLSHQDWLKQVSK
jgi:hydroxymethylbilane synthase